MQDNIVFLHACHNPTYLSLIQKDWFDNPTIKELFDITKSYHGEFGQLPFKIEADDPMIQLKQYVESTSRSVVIDSNMTAEENIKSFWVTVPEVINFEYSSIDKTYLVGKDGMSGSFHSWLEYKSFTTGLTAGLKYLKAQRDTGAMVGIGGVRETITRTLEIVNAGGTVPSMNAQEVSFDDPEAHKQVLPEDLVKTGFKMFDRFLSEEDGYDGAARGTVTYIYAGSNVGKSLLLGNLALGTMKNGVNCLFVSLEMRTHKIIRRMGANIFNISMGKYGEFSSDQNRMTRTIESHKKQASDMFAPWGHFHLIKLASCDPIQLEALVGSLEKKHGIKYKAIFLDYFGLLASNKNIDPTNTYVYHKVNSAQLAQVAERTDTCIFTPHQVKVGDYDDVKISSGAGSSAIIHNADSIMGLTVTQSPETHKKQFTLEMLKARDSKYKGFTTTFEIDYEHMKTIPNDDLNEPQDDFIF